MKSLTLTHLHLWRIIVEVAVYVNGPSNFLVWWLDWAAFYRLYGIIIGGQSYFVERNWCSHLDWIFSVIIFHFQNCLFRNFLALLFCHLALAFEVAAFPVHCLGQNDLTKRCTFFILFSLLWKGWISLSVCLDDVFDWAVNDRLCGLVWQVQILIIHLLISYSQKVW